ncbi:MAG TPA: hypothetical protein VK774_04250 [Solirubrobacteraceae bacterium]|nr:hypothetical protein [Solirubrobacteraceae bacterium]
MKTPTLAVAALLLAAIALLCSGCETTAEKSAKLEKAAKRQTLAKQQGLTITQESAVVKVLDTALVHGKEGSAAVVTLRNSSPRALSGVPISLTLKDAHGATVYSNGTPGLAKTLTSVSLIPAHGKVVWIDDQIQAPTASAVAVRIGEGSPASGALPQLKIADTHLTSEAGTSSTFEGTVHNGSSTDQPELVIEAVARRGKHVVAAGRAVLASLEAGTTTPFEVFFIGTPGKAKLELSPQPTALG